MSSEDESETPNTSTRKSYCKIWSDEQTRKLLDLYHEYFPQIGIVGRFSKKKQMWEQMEEDFNHELSAKQCEERYKTIMKRKKKRIYDMDSSYHDPVVKKPKKSFETRNIKVSLSTDDEETSFIANTSDRWSIEDTNILLDLYDTYIVQVGPAGRFPREKHMWNQIADDLRNKTSWQCEHRYNTLLIRNQRKDCNTSATQSTENENPSSESELEETNELKIYKSSIWSADESKKLLELYSCYLPQIGQEMGIFKNKKEMWTQISIEINNKTPKQCEERFKTIMKRKASKDMMARRYEENTQNKESEEINEDAFESPLTENAIEPEFYLSAPYSIEQIEINKQLGEEVQNRTAGVQATYMKILKKQTKAKINRNAGKERRHREKMEAVEKMQSILNEKLQEKETKQNPDISSDLLKSCLADELSEEILDGSRHTKRKLSIQATLMKISEKREEARLRQEEAKERRHIEKMEALNRLHNLFFRLLQENNTDY